MTPEQRKTHLFAMKRAVDSLAVFCREVLGYADMTAEHVTLCDFLQHRPEPAKLVMMPRYTFKSCICTVGYALWRLVREDSLRVLIYSDASARSEAFLTDIKNHLLAKSARSTFRQMFGPWEVDPKQGVWNQTAIVVRPRRHAQAEPSVDTAGLETSRVGAHYDLIIFDDLVTKENVTTKEQMDKVHECYKAARSLLKPGGEILIVGTRWHFGDMYGRLLAEDAQRTVQGLPPSFATHIRDAEVGTDGTPYPFQSIGLTKAFLDQQRAEQGSYLYSCLYRLSPVDDATAIFKGADFRFYDPTQMPKGLYVTCCVDPAISQSSDADDTAITVVGTDEDVTLHLLDIAAGHMLPDQIIDEIMRLHARWQFSVLGLETNAFQKMLKRDLDRRIEQERRTNPRFKLFQVVEFTGTSQQSKELRIRGLQPYHERGALKLPGTRLETLSGPYQTLAMQMLQFPHATHDDILDSLAYHVPIHRQGHVTITPDEIPYSSAAWFERRQHEKLIKELARRPRWNRPPLPSLAFS